MSIGTGNWSKCNITTHKQSKIKLLIAGVIHETIHVNTSKWIIYMA